MNPIIMIPSEATAVASRKTFGQSLVELGASNEKIVVLDADLSKSTMSIAFSKKYPKRFFEMGIQEANMISTASGLALSGYTPFCCSFAAFLTGRFDQIKMSVAYSEAPVVLVGTHAGIGIGPDGYSQQSLEDIALMRSLPKMLVLQPADELETQQMMSFLTKNPQSAYLRLTRQNLPRVHSDDFKFELGKFSKLISGDDLAIFATGGTVSNAKEAALKLHAMGIKTRVYNASSIKPIDQNAIITAAKECKALISIEDHNILGGLGGAIAEVISEHQPTKLLRLGVNDEFGESGTPAALYEKHNLDIEGITKRVNDFYDRL